MLLIDIPRIPPEGFDLDEALDPVALHLGGEAELALRPGGRLRAHVEVVDHTTLHVRGRLDGTLDVDCARCLDWYVVTLGQELDLFAAAAMAPMAATLVAIVGPTAAGKSALALRLARERRGEIV